jgi:hypothetical protein
MDPVSLFLRHLMTRVNDAVASHVENLTQGKGIDEIAHYREKVGYIRALRDVSEWVDEVHSDLMRPDEQQLNPNRAVPQRVVERIERLKRNVNYEK